MTEPVHGDATTPDYLVHLTDDVARMAELLGRCDPSTAVPSCPGWDLRRLTVHVGNVHRWATAAARAAAPPPSRPADPDHDVNLGAWLRAGAQELVDTLRMLEPQAPTWHPFPTELVAAVWPRRMALETAVHRVDAQLAAGTAAPRAAEVVDAALASDGIDEYLGVMLTGAAQRRGRQLPASTLHVHCTDVHGEWLVWAKGASVTVQREHAKGDVAMRGPASSLFLALWGRRWAEPGFETFGDDAAGADWLAVGGA